MKCGNAPKKLAIFNSISKSVFAHFHYITKENMKKVWERVPPHYTPDIYQNTEKTATMLRFRNTLM